MLISILCSATLDRLCVLWTLSQLRYLSCPKLLAKRDPTFIARCEWTLTIWARLKASGPSVSAACKGVIFHSQLCGLPMFQSLDTQEEGLHSRGWDWNRSRVKHNVNQGPAPVLGTQEMLTLGAHSLYYACSTAYRCAWMHGYSSE